MIKQLIYTIIIVFTGLAVTFFLGLFLMHDSNSVVSLHEFLSNHIIKFAIWRYSIFFLIIYFWPQLIKWIGKKQKWPPRAIIKILRMRFKIVIFFVSFEILVVYNGLDWFIGKIIGLF